MIVGKKQKKIHDSTVTRMIEFHQKNNTLSVKVQNLEREVKRLETQILDLKTRNEDTENRLRRIEASLIADRCNHCLEGKFSTTKNEGLSVKVQNLEREVIEHKTHIEKLETQAIQQKTHIVKLETQIVHLETGNELTENRLRIIEASLIADRCIHCMQGKLSTTKCCPGCIFEYTIRSNRTSNRTL